MILLAGIVQQEEGYIKSFIWSLFGVSGSYPEPGERKQAVVEPKVGVGLERVSPLSSPTTKS
jgi:hypothetical protein